MLLGFTLAMDVCRHSANGSWNAGGQLGIVAASSSSPAGDFPSSQS